MCQRHTTADEKRVEWKSDGGNVRRSVSLWSCVPAYKFDPDACKHHGLLLPQGKHGGESLNRARHPIAVAVRM